MAGIMSGEGVAAKGAMILAPPMHGDKTIMGHDGMRLRKFGFFRESSYHKKKQEAAMKHKAAVVGAGIYYDTVQAFLR